MKTIKTEFHYFTIMDYEKEQDYLRSMHKAGWEFSGVTFPGFYHFVQCEPEDVIYQLDYNLEGIAHKEDYVQMFEDCGWEYLMDFVGYSYFRKPAAQTKEGEGIFCDDASRLAMMDRVFKGRMLPLLCIFFAVILPQLFLQCSPAASRASFLLFLAFLVLFSIYMEIFLSFFKKYWTFRRRNS